MQRLDLVFDRYFLDSLKVGARSNHGTGVLRKETENGMLPRNWKRSCFHFFSKKTVYGLNNYKTAVAAVNENVLSNQSLYLYIMPCNIEEADERKLLHVNNAANHFSKQLIKTLDCDVNGRRKTLQYILVHEIAKGFGIVGSKAISFFHALGGCDTTSAVAGKRKLSFYNHGILYPQEDGGGVFIVPWGTLNFHLALGGLAKRGV